MERKILFTFMLVFWKDSNQSEIKNTVPILEEESVRIFCDEEVTLHQDNFEAFQETKSVKTAIIDSCSPLESGSYAEVLRNLNLNISHIRALHLIENPRIDNYAELKRPRPQHFLGLNLEELQILNHDGPSAPAFDLNFLVNFPNLTKLTIQNYDIWGPFPYLSKLETVEIFGGTFYGDLGACQGFIVLHFSGVHIIEQKKKEYNNFFKDCVQLVDLKLEHMNKCISFLQGLTKTLRSLTVRHCELDVFPYSFSLFEEKKSSYNKADDFILSSLDVSHNKIKSSGFLASYKALETLDVSHNDLYLRSIYYLPKVVELKLDYNNLESLCDYSGTDQYREWQLPLRILSAAGTGLTSLCFGNTGFPYLERLNLTYNNITVLDYRQLYNVSGGMYAVDLTDNPLDKIEFSQEDYEALKRNDPSVAHWRNITIIYNAELPCDCSNAWFTRAIREQLLTIEGAECIDGSSIDQPKLSYALQGCAGACEGVPGCFAAEILYHLMNFKGYIFSLSADQNTVWGLASGMFDVVLYKFIQ